MFKKCNKNLLLFIDVSANLGSVSFDLFEESNGFFAHMLELLQTFQTLLEVLKNHNFFIKDKLLDDPNQANLNAGMAFAHKSGKQLIELVDPKDVSFDEFQKHVTLENFFRLQDFVRKLFYELFQQFVVLFHGGIFDEMQELNEISDFLHAIGSQEHDLVDLDIEISSQFVKVFQCLDEVQSLRNQGLEFLTPLLRVHIVNGIQLQVHLLQNQHELIQHSHLISFELSLEIGFLRSGGAKVFINLQLVLAQRSKSRSQGRG